MTEADRRLLREVRATPPAQLARRGFAFQDARYATLLFRYRARNWPHTLDPDEAQLWQAFCERRLDTDTELTTLTRERYLAEIAALRATVGTTPAQHALLDALEQWGRGTA